MTEPENFKALDRDKPISQYTASGKWALYTMSSSYGKSAWELQGV